MPHTESIRSPEIEITHVVPVVAVDPIKYDSFAPPPMATDYHGHKPIVYTTNSLRSTSEDCRETMDAEGRKSRSRSSALDFTSVRIPT